MENEKNYKPIFYVEPKDVISELKKYMLVDGFDFVLDLFKSQGSYFQEARDGKKYNDFFTCFASIPLGLNHPKMLEPSFLNYLAKIALNKPSNSDIYSDPMATFVKTFFEVAVPDYFKYSFFIEGGALAVENALKAAFDWKVRKNFAKGYKFERGHQILHFNQAFHGRSGYTMSLTNTDPNKIALFPKFDWPRVLNPKIKYPVNAANTEYTISQEKESIAQIKQAFVEHKDDIAAIIIEPIQGEGGDNHFRNEYMKQLRQLADENDALLIFDEIQCGIGLSGTMWAHQQMDVIPDLMTFGKKMQVCGFLSTNRIDDIEDNVFHKSSRINSTWGGNLVDMVRATRYLEIMQEENIINNVQKLGKILLNRLDELSIEFPEMVTGVRGRGLMCAFDMPNDEIRTKFRNTCFDNGLIILPSGECSIRCRPPLNVTLDELEEALSIVRLALRAVV